MDGASNVTMIMPSLFVTRLIVPAGLIIADENVDLLYSGRPWIDY